jgi:5-hydroxyisourate hydrolase-like protein (transthyretin family)
MKSSRNCLTLLLFAWLVSAAPGCGEKPGPTLVPVSGTVKTADGKPVADAFVTLQPQSREKEAPTATGKTDSEGKFKLMTGKKEGAVPGNYLVRISKANDADDDSGKANKEQIAEKHNAKSKTAYTVPAEGTDAAAFTVDLVK